MRTKFCASWVVFASASLAGCLSPAEEADTEDAVASAGSVGQSGIIANAGVSDVGVIPDAGQSCPAGADEIVIRMDDEDSDNRSARSGWVGKTNTQETSSATRFYFCKVDGTLFRPFTTDANGSTSAGPLGDAYAVLKLGTTCPAGSQQFFRHFDNEDSGNGNFSIGVISPNVVNQDTTLYFCLFRYATASVATISAFPTFGAFHYGVFASSVFQHGVLGKSGNIHTDDEDSGNTSTYNAPSDAQWIARQIVNDPPNTNGTTDLHTFQVR